MTRVLIFLAVVLAVFLPLNWIACRQLLRLHSRRRRWVVLAAVAGNAMWLFLPFLRSFTTFGRVTRAVFGPLWFGWLVFVLLYSTFLLLVLVAWLPLRRRPFREFARLPSTVFLIALAVAFCAGFYQALVPLRVARVTIRVAGLPASAAGARIALLGDLHVGLFTRPSRLEQIFRATASLDPGVIVIAGDLLDDDPWFAPKLVRAARALPPAIPLYAVLGNHEMYGDPFAVIAALRGSRVSLLVNEGVPWRGVWLAGVSDPAASQLDGEHRLDPDLGRALAAKPPGVVPIVIAHQAKILEQARALKVPVVLTAHTHGGQFGVRPLGWSLAGVFLRYHMGLYDVPPSQLYINTGTGYWLFPFRLGMTPEITLIELVPASPLT